MCFLSSRNQISFRALGSFRSLFGATAIDVGWLATQSLANSQQHNHESIRHTSRDKVKVKINDKDKDKMRLAQHDEHHKHDSPHNQRQDSQGATTTPHYHGRVTIASPLQHPQQQPQQQQQQPQQPRSQPPNDGGDDEWLFSCRCESAKSVSTLLTCLKGSSAMQPVTVFVSPSSITFHVFGTARQSQASVDLQAGLFSHYQVHTPTTTANTTVPTTANTFVPTHTAGICTTRDDDEPVHEPTPPQHSTATQPWQDWHAGGEFSVNLTTVLDCLHVLGTQSLDKTKLSLSYNLHTEVFKLELLEEGGVLATAAIPGMLPPTTGDSLALAFRSAPVTARMIVTSDCLRDAMQELDLVHGAATCIVALDLMDWNCWPWERWGRVSLQYRGKAVSRSTVLLLCRQDRTPWHRLLGPCKVLNMLKRLA